MGKRRIVAETGAGQHGVATATACALLGLECVVYMGAEDMARQAPNVLRMRLLGAEVRSVDAGSRTLKDAINEAMRDWVTNVADTYYLLGSVLGPHPYPLMVREFQSVIGREARAQMLAQAGRLPTRSSRVSAAAATPWASSTASSTIAGVRLIGVEAGGEGIAPGRHAARFAGGGARHPAGHADLGAAGRARQHRADALDFGGSRLRRGRPRARVAARAGPHGIRATRPTMRRWTRSQTLARLEGILPALESSHAVAHAHEAGAGARAATRSILVNLSGRGDKDLATVQKTMTGRRPTDGALRPDAATDHGTHHGRHSTA